MTLSKTDFDKIIDDAEADGQLITEIYVGARAFQDLQAVPGASVTATGTPAYAYRGKRFTLITALADDAVIPVT